MRFINISFIRRWHAVWWNQRPFAGCCKTFPGRIQPELTATACVIDCCIALSWCATAPLGRTGESKSMEKRSNRDNGMVSVLYGRVKINNRLVQPLDQRQASHKTKKKTYWGAWIKSIYLYFEQNIHVMYGIQCIKIQMIQLSEIYINSIAFYP